MNQNIKKTIKFFWLPDYEKEEEYLSKMHESGWKLKKNNGFVYTFEKCEPENVVYRLDFDVDKNTDKQAYIKVYDDYGWEYIQDMNDYSYFRKSSDGLSDKDLEIFSDNESRLDMIKKIIKTKLLPLWCIFMCIVIPNAVIIFIKDFGRMSIFFTVFWTLMLVIYTYVFLHCYLGFRKLKKKYSK